MFKITIYLQPSISAGFLVKIKDPNQNGGHVEAIMAGRYHQFCIIMAANNHTESKFIFHLKRF